MTRLDLCPQLKGSSRGASATTHPICAAVSPKTHAYVLHIVSYLYTNIPRYMSI